MSVYTKEQIDACLAMSAEIYRCFSRMTELHAELVHDGKDMPPVQCGQVSGLEMHMLALAESLRESVNPEVVGRTTDAIKKRILERRE